MKISIIFGTRPEAIKLAPVILELKKHPEINCHVCVTAQHREMLDQVLEVFEIVPDTDLAIMEPNQSLAELSSRTIKELDVYFSREKPDFVIVQGDTTTTFIATLVSFYHHIPVGHVEAGLRTGNMQSPWPEEANRILTTRLATLHFAPTENNRQNLINEGIPSDRIYVTGNTVIDALLMAVGKIKANPPAIPGLSFSFAGDMNDPKVVLITGHRRESFGEGFRSICKAISKLAKRFPEVQFIYPVHLNPNVRRPVMEILGGGNGSKNVHLIDPLPYFPFVSLINRSTLILTDSGGIQEEAPSLGKPILVMRDTTERSEGLAAGTARLVGTDSERISNSVSHLLTDAEAYYTMSQAKNPYGDGQSAQRIVEILVGRFTYPAQGQPI